MDDRRENAHAAHVNSCWNIAIDECRMNSTILRARHSKRTHEFRIVFCTSSNVWRIFGTCKMEEEQNEFAGAKKIYLLSVERMKSAKMRVNEKKKKTKNVKWKHRNHFFYLTIFFYLEKILTFSCFIYLAQSTCCCCSFVYYLLSTATNTAQPQLHRIWGHFSNRCGISKWLFYLVCVCSMLMKIIKRTGKEMRK